MIRRREAKVSDVGGKKTLRPLPYTVYGNCRDKRFSVQARKDHFHTNEIIKRMDIEIQAGQRRSTAPSSKGPITVVMA